MECAYCGGILSSYSMRRSVNALGEKVWRCKNTNACEKRQKSAT